jgi:hypothetical protein
VLPSRRRERWSISSDAQGRDVASGVYLAEISMAGVESARAKLTLVR